MTAQAQENHQKAARILDLYENEKTRFIEVTHSQHAIKALDFIFTRPVFQASAFTGQAGVPKSTAIRILSILRKEGLFSVLSEKQGRKPAVLAFRELLNIAEGREVF